RSLMQKIAFRHGGAEYDAKYPDGIPTSLTITADDGSRHDSGFVMYPAGHARNTTADLEDILAHKFKLLGSLAVKSPDAALARLTGLGGKTSGEIQEMYGFDIEVRGGFA